jgi:Lamin Tail Domain
MKTISIFAALALAGLVSVQGAVPVPTLFITEVHSGGNSNSTYGADWFELTNTGAASLDITGWKVDDNSNAFANALDLRGIASIAPGESVVFIESNADGTNDATRLASLTAAWFGSNIPANFKLGYYGGSGIGLSGTSDAVNIYDASGTLITNVTFGLATTGVTFDNAAGVTGGAISPLSVAGVNGAFPSVTGGEIGSPGFTAVPEPGSYAILVAGTLVALVVSRRRFRSRNA